MPTINDLSDTEQWVASTTLKERCSVQDIDLQLAMCVTTLLQVHADNKAGL